ncbi:MAG: DUF1211 domain-containing protein [Actinobacteria bacterium]|nr:DUF1211 domain-containing protein [Actinomycetota bacterium]MCG2795483.1 DUF1211 domain-containing protein [Actinomycetes bacterium]
MENDRAAPPESAADDSSIGVDRIIAFSDAVFAVAITLLVLNIDVPQVSRQLADVKLPAEIWALWPKFAAFIVSFLIIGFFWAFHHMMFKNIRRHTNLFLWMNLLLLMCIVFMPFSAALFSEYTTTEVATMFYAASWAVPSFLLALMWWYATDNKRLVDEQYKAISGRHATFAFLNTGFIFLLSMPIAIINVGAAQYFWLMLIPTHFLLGRYFGKRGA